MISLRNKKIFPNYHQSTTFTGTLFSHSPEIGPNSKWKMAKFEFIIGQLYGCYHHVSYFFDNI